MQLMMFSNIMHGLLTLEWKTLITTHKVYTLSLQNYIFKKR